MWRVDWFGNYSEFSKTFSTKEEAKKFYNNLVTSRKTLYKAY